MLCRRFLLTGFRMLGRCNAMQCNAMRLLQTVEMLFVFSQKSNIQQLKEEIREKLPVVSNTGTLRHSHKKSRPAPPPPMSTNGSGGSSDLEIRAPSELLVGVPATLTTQWRHHPHALVSGSVNYIANVSTAQTRSRMQTLIVAHIVKTFPDFRGTRRFVTLFTKVQHWTLS
jgi:hypothetical protein